MTLRLPARDGTRQQPYPSGMQEVPSGSSPDSSALAVVRQNVERAVTTARGAAAETGRRLRTVGAVIADGMVAFYDELLDLRTDLLERGWYLSPDIRFSAVLRVLAARGDDDALDQVLADITRERLPDVLAAAGQTWPHRASLLDQAADAHRRGQYGLSVPVFLAQADGICRDMFSAPLFSTVKRGNRRRPRVSAMVEASVAQLRVSLGDAAPRAYFTYFLEELSALQLGKEEREVSKVAGLGPLNRHAVAHGEDVRYGTELNSLRAVALLDYLVHLKRLESLPMPQHGLAIPLAFLGMVSTARRPAPTPVQVASPTPADGLN
jgi:hypothetical protein